MLPPGLGIGPVGGTTDDVELARDGLELEGWLLAPPGDRFGFGVKGGDADDADPGDLPCGEKKVMMITRVCVYVCVCACMHVCVCVCVLQ